MNSSSSSLLLLIALVVGPAAALLGVGRTQSVAVQGRLICNGRPASGVKVKLYEKEAKQKAYDTRDSQAVSDPSTNRAQRCLTCQIGRDGVLSTWYGPFDVKMDETQTNQNGEFRVSGSKNEISNIDPKVNLYHRCNYNGPCYKKIGITIPDQYISSGSNPQKVYDIGTLNLANQYTGQTTDCIN